MYMDESKQLLYKNKITVFKDILANLKKKKDKHYNKYKKLKCINNFLKVGVNILNAGSICALVITYMGLTPVIVLSLSLTSLSSLIIAGMNSYDIDYKIQSHNNSYLQYSEIYRHYQSVLIKNGLTSKQLDEYLNEMNEKINLVMDTEEPI